MPEAADPFPPTAPAHSNLNTLAEVNIKILA